MQTNPQKNQKGFIALISVIIISAILVGMTFAASQNGFFARFNTLNGEFKRISLGLAESCQSAALLKLAQDYYYVPAAGGDMITVGAQSCLIDSVTPTDHTYRQTHDFITAAITTHACYPSNATDPTKCANTSTFSDISVNADVQNPGISHIPPTTLGVTAVVPSGANLSDFHLSVDGGPVTSGQQLTVTPNVTHAVSVDLAPAGYTTTGWAGDCVSTSPVTKGVTSAVLVTGSNNSCYIFYKEQPTTATLTLVANVPAGADLSNFPLKIDNQAVINGQTVISSTPIDVASGVHTATYSIPANYQASSWNGICDPTTGQTGSLVAGQNYTCVINFIQPSPACADTVMMLDRTGSITATDRANEKAAANGILNLYSPLSPAPKVGLGVFGAPGSGEPYPATIVQSLTTNYSSLSNALNSGLASSGGNTNISDAINKSNTELLGLNDGLKKVMIMISDGQANRPTSGAVTAATNSANAAKNTGTQIYTIHYGAVASMAPSYSGTSQDYLASLANSSAVNYATTSTDTGYKFPSASSPSTGGWTTPANAYTDTDSGASATETGFSHLESYYNFNFNGVPTGLPSGAALNGIEVKAGAWVKDSPAAGNANLAPQTVGNYKYWIANSGTSVNAVNANDGDTSYISDTDQQTFAFPSANVPAGATNISVTLNAYAKSVGGTASMKFMAENGTSQVAEASGRDLAATYTLYSWPMNSTNPMTSAPWVSADLNGAIKFGVQKTNNSFAVPRVTQLWLTISYVNSANLNPTGLGTTNSWSVTGTTDKVIAVTDATPTTFINSTAINQNQSFVFAGAGIPTGTNITSSVNSVTLNTSAARSSSGTGTPTIKMRIENTDNTNSQLDPTTRTLSSTSYNPFSWNMATNPLGGSWSVGEVNNWTARFGASRTDANSRQAQINQIYLGVNYSVSVNLSPSGLGNFNYWVPNVGTQDVAVGSNDGDTTYIDDAGQQTFTFQPANIPAGATNISVTLNAYAESVGGTASMKFMAENGTSQVAEASGRDLAATYTLYSWPMNSTNPLTSVPWVPADLNGAIKFGVQKTNNGAAVPRVTQLYLVVSYNSVPVSASCELGVDLSYDGGSHWTPTAPTPIKIDPLTGTETVPLSFGGQSDNWSRAWQPANFSNGNFRVRVHAIDPDPGSNIQCADNAVVNLDWIQARVWYTTYGVDVVGENSDNDNFFISPTSADLVNIFNTIGKKVCPAAAAATQALVNVSTHVINSNGGVNQPSDFHVTVTGANASPATFDGSLAGTTVIVDPNTAFSIAETGPAEYFAPQYIGCNASGNSIATGQTIYCSLVNYDKPPAPAPPSAPLSPTNINIGSWQEANSH